MLFADELIAVRGGGDLGTGVVARLSRSGFPVLVLEVAEPLAIRRAVAVATAVDIGAVQVEDLEARLAGSAEEAVALARSGSVAVMVSPELPDLPLQVVVDARMAKRTLDTRIDQAPLVVALGPGFEAGVDCHAVVETARGSHLGRTLWTGRAQADTGQPGIIEGESGRRVIRAPGAGRAAWQAAIGDVVAAGDQLGAINGQPVRTEIAGVVRGLITEGRKVAAGTKIADVDPRGEAAACFEISDKALAVGGGVLEAVLVHLNGRS